MLILVFDAAKIQIFFYINKIHTIKSNKNTPLFVAEFQSNDIFKSRSTGTGSLNPYHSSSYNYSFNSRYFSLGLTWRIGRMELEEKASQSRVMKQH